MSLRESWARTRRHLDAARSKLPSREEVDSTVQAHLERLDEWLANNELELALDELASLDSLVECPPAFWKELLLATENMGLQEHAAIFRARLP